MFSMRVRLGKTRLHDKFQIKNYAFLGAPKIVKWGVPEKILQMQFSIRRAGLRSIGPSSQKLGRIKSRLPGRTLPA